MRREFWQILYTLRAEGVAMVISTVYLDEAERCDRLALLHQGSIMYCDTPRRLKQGMPGAIIRITSSSPRLLLAAVSGLAGVQGSLPVGEGVHVHVDDATRRLPELAHAIALAGIATSDMMQVDPGIEDLFVALLQHRQATQ